MSIIGELAQIIHHGRLAHADQAATGEIIPALLPGWDVAHDPLRVDPPGVGVWRAQHLGVRFSLEWTQLGLHPILSPTLRQAELAAGLWRQLRIFPDSEDWRRSAVRGKAENNPFLPAEDLAADLTRDIFIRSLLGHTVRDAADFLTHVREHHSLAGQFLLAKDFKSAAACDPDIVQEPWPAVTLNRWKKDGGRDFLPPFLFLALLAELARLAQNQAALLALTFDEDGNELTLTGMADQLSLPQAQRTDAVNRLLSYAPLQSTAVLPPDIIYKDVDSKRGKLWSEAVATALTLAGREYGPGLIHNITSERSPAVDDLIAQAARAHPDLQKIARKPNRETSTSTSNSAPEGTTFAMKKGLAVTFWSMPWRLHAAVGLLLLADQARSWSKVFRKQAPLPAHQSAKRGLPFNTTQAAGAITYLWLESLNEAALKSALAHVNEAKLRAAPMEERDDIASELETETIDSLATAKHFGGELITAARSELADLMHSGKPGETVRPGCLGYTALYHAHLWLSDRGDDLKEFEGLQHIAVQQQHAAGINRRFLSDENLSRISPAVLDRTGMSRTLPKGVANRAKAAHSMTLEVEAARGAQNQAMTVSAMALDPMRSFLARPRRAARLRAGSK
jgi:hypothetical protein